MLRHMSELYVSQLTTYPIKSCGGIDMPSAEVGPQGLEYDRQWMVTRANGTFLTQRTFPKLALVETDITDDDMLVVSAPNHGTIEIPLDATDMADNRELEVDVFKKPGKGREQGPEAAAFFSEYLGINALLLRVSHERHVKAEKRVSGYSEQLGFADGAPLLLASQVSLRALQQASEGPIEMNRFRPNVVVDSHDQDTDAYDEDYWREIRIGELGAYVAWACARCPMPNIDQSVGDLPKPAGRYVTRVLQASRSGIDPSDGKEEVYFAQNIVPRTDGGAIRVNVGDALTVVSRAAERNFQPL